ncbi:hypothetical protein D3C86_1031980 [compost metagenome]
MKYKFSDMQAVHFYDVDFFFDFVAASDRLFRQYRKVVFRLNSIGYIIIAAGIKNIIIRLASYPNLNHDFVIAIFKRNFIIKIFVF